MKPLIELAVDIGKTRIKIGTFKDGQCETLKTYEVQENINIFESPNKFKNWILKQTDFQIERLAFSITGRINHLKNEVIKSDLLGESFNGCKFSSLFSPIPTEIYNDGISSSLAYIYLSQNNKLPYPCLCISLGTGVAISVVDISKSNYEIFYFDRWPGKVKIGTSEGLKRICDAINNETMDKMVKMKGLKRFNDRVLRTFKEILIIYNKRFNYQPKGIFINGGRSKFLDFEMIKSVLSYIEIPEKVDDERQIENLLLGILNANKIREKIIIHTD